MLRHIWAGISLTLLVVGSSQCAAATYVSDSVYYFVYRHPLSSKDRKKSWAKHLPRLIKYKNPDNPAESATLKTRGVKLCAVSKSTLKTSSLKTLPKNLNEASGFYCTETLPLIQDAGISVDKGMLSLLLYLEAKDGSTITAESTADAYKLRVPLVLRLPLAAKVSHKEVSQQISKLESQIKNRLTYIWSTLLNYRSDELDVERDALFNWITNLTEPESPSDDFIRLKLKYIIRKQMTWFDAVFQLSQTAVGSSKSLNEVLVEKGPRGLFPDRALFSEFVNGIEKWNSATLPGPYFTVMGLSRAGFHSFDACKTQSYPVKDHTHLTLFMSKLVMPWLCRTSHLVFELSQYGQKSWSRAAQKAYADLDSLDLNKIFKGEPTILRAIKQLKDTPNQPVLSLPYLKLKFGELALKNMVSAKTKLAKREKVLSDLKSENAKWSRLTLDPSWLKNLEADDLISQSLSANTTEQYRKRLINDYTKLVLSPVLKSYLEEIKTSLVQKSTYRFGVDSVVSEGRILPWSYVPQVLSVIREKVLTHVYETVRLLGAPSGAHKKMAKRWLEAKQVLRFLFLEDLHSDALSNSWVQNANASTPPPVTYKKTWQALKKGFLDETYTTRNGFSLIYELKPCFNEESEIQNETQACLVARKLFLKKLEKGLKQVDWILFVYHRLFDPSETADQFDYVPDEGEFQVQHQALTVDQKKHDLIFMGQKKSATRPFELLKGNRDPLKDVVQWHDFKKQNDIYRQVSLCDATQGANEFCVKWTPKAFYKKSQDQSALEWQLSPWGLPGRTASVRAEFLQNEPYKSALNEATQMSEDLVRALSDSHLRVFLETEKKWLKAYNKDGLNWQWALYSRDLPLSVAQSLKRHNETDKIVYEIPSILRIRSVSYDASASMKAQVDQYFMIYSVIKPVRKSMKYYELEMLTWSKVTFSSTSDQKVVSSYMKKAERFLYPQLYGKETWRGSFAKDLKFVDGKLSSDLVGHLWAAFMNGFQETPLESGSKLTNQKLEAEYQNKEQVYRLNAKKWHPFRHRHTWLSQDKISINLGGHLSVYDLKQGLMYRSDNHNMADRLVHTPIANSLKGSSKPAKLWHDWMKSPFEWFYHLPLGPGHGFIPPYFGMRDKSFGLHSFVLSDWYHSLPKPSYWDLDWMDDYFPLLRIEVKGKTPSSKDYFTLFPQVKMIPTLPYSPPFVNMDTPRLNIRRDWFGHVMGATEMVRIYSLFQDDDVEVLTGPGAKFLWVHTGARAQQLHMGPSSLFFPSRSYVTHIPLEAKQAAPQLLQMVGWHQSGGAPFSIHHFDEKIQRRLYQCLAMPYCRYNPKFHSYTLDDSSALMSYVAYPKTHVDLAKKAAGKWFWDVEDGAYDRYKELHGEPKDRYQAYLLFVDGLENSGSGLKEIKTIKRFSLGAGEIGETLLKKKVYLHWVPKIRSMAVTGGSL